MGLCCGSTDRVTKYSKEDIQQPTESEPLKYDPDFKGPLSKRSCTDLPCLFLFVTFLCAWGYVAYYAVQHGDLNRLLVPIDSDGRKCGVDSEVRDEPYLVFFNITECAKIDVPISGCSTTQVCVSQCPNQDFDFESANCNPSNVNEIRSKLICKQNVKKSDLTTCQIIRQYIKSQRCAQTMQKSTPLVNRCVSNIPEGQCTLIPKQFRQQPPITSTKFQTSAEQCKEQRELENILEEKISKLQSFLARYVNNLISVLTKNNSVHQTSQMIVEDILESWRMILVFIACSVLASLILIAMLRWIAKPLVWISIIGVITALSYGVYYSFRQYQQIRANPVAAHVNVSPNLSSLVNSWFKSDQTWLWILIALSVILIVLLLVVLVLRKRIVIAIALLKEGSKAVSASFSTVFFPLVPWILQAVVIVFSLLVLLFLASIGVPVYKVNGLNSSLTCVCTNGYMEGDICDPVAFNENCRDTSRIYDQERCLDAACHFQEVDTPGIVRFFHALNVIGFFWCICFVSAFSEMVLAFTFATWYWTRQKSRLPFFVLTRGVTHTVYYHLGTLAFGSLIIAICKIIRAILEYVDHKLKRYDNGFTRAVLCCCRCFFWCLESFLKFLNRNAYIMCAIYGKNFCSSAKDAFSLLTRNVLRVIALDKVTGFLFFLSKLLLASGMAAVTYTYFDSDLPKMQLNYPFVPAVLVFIGTFIIASIFFSVYSVAVDTLFLCFLEDIERNDGSAERPFYMSRGLQKILGKKQK
ncbi:choline transporter-like 2 isoform X1 [Anopheles gambiae]|uniref:choline transporter-like 2 isoform X1 n=1 Tax=Anopheles coluzzii TaxID=1518534 RepID=UPI0020FF7E7C|nr:choline transporter-like 2 isoform X1 [Anopheles coluzzii]XP_040233133.2 choline transporter-like 2 isoform X1 [Anopheles coluzzii]XP_040233134.2 choline transporter-like 2 isoform X1 [Anopheles coluzzii]XP_061511114.1 choline transporter-like 2 isoform X1 [Anopheles gambiae]XP_061511115.1 choline transporter-like 2 isoform X1 [Anopheles gambiae]XP_061511116.1 choline transporter-like 2 isoform X1 [Anopheles gambiae]XP_061511117.1 choline transporter-like 2 isoform X1 [Anopheles gambiae]